MPDCDLTNPAAQDNRATGGDFCGAMVNANFGKVVPGATFDPEPLRGWGKRNYNWEFSAGVQQRARRARVGRRQLLPPLVRQLHGDRQPGDRAVRLRSVQHHRAVGSAPAGGGGYVDQRSLRSEPGAVRRAGPELRDALGQLRQADRALERRRRQSAARGQRRRCCSRAASAPGGRRPTTATWWPSWTTRARCTATSTRRS